MCQKIMRYDESDNNEDTEYDSSDDPLNKEGWREMMTNDDGNRIMNQMKICNEEQNN